MTTANARDGAALLAALRADPADALCRCALADWLEEQGKDAQARWVRMGLERREPAYVPVLGNEQTAFVWHYGGGRPDLHGMASPPSLLPTRLFIRLSGHAKVGAGCLHYATREDAMEALYRAARKLGAEPLPADEATP